MIKMRVMKITMKSAISNRLQQLCKERNITLHWLAVHSGVTPSTVYSIMNSKGEDVSIITVKRLCDGLNITLKEFFNDSDFQ